MVGMIADDMDISIHALRKESDLMIYATVSHHLFQSTLSVRRATQ